MHKGLLYMTTAMALISVAFAEEHGTMNHQQHVGTLQGDARQLVHFPPEMRQHTLANMRDHLQALSEIMTALAGGHYDEAARIANARLGMESPSADGCKESNATGSATPSAMPTGMDHRMAQFMPEGMRRIGLDMHRAASDFAAAAAKTSQTGDGTPALASLAQVTGLCVACHAAYRLP